MNETTNIPSLRFPEFDTKWEEKRIEKLFSEFQSGKGIISTEISDHGKYPVYGGNGLRGFAESFTHEGFYVLIGRQGALCGNVNRAYGKSYISEHAIAGKANKESDTEFLAQRLDHFNLNRLSESSAQPGLSVQKVVRYKLIVPAISEQQKIASFLTSVDTKIQQLTKKKNLLVQYKKGVMQKIFSQEIRFKDENGNEYPDWEERKLGEVAIKQSSNIAANTIEENEGSYKIYGAAGLLKRVDFYREDVEYISIVKDGAGVGRVLFCEPYSSVLGTLDIIKPKYDTNLYFIYCLIDNIDFTKYITGSTIPHIYFKDYSNERVGIPCLEEQTQIANILSAIDDKIALVGTELEKTQEFKKGLLQQMFV